MQQLKDDGASQGYTKLKRKYKALREVNSNLHLKLIFLSNRSILEYWKIGKTLRERLRNFQLKESKCCNHKKNLDNNIVKFWHITKFFLDF